MAEAGQDLIAGSVLKFDFWIRDEQDSLTTVSGGCFTCQVFTVNPKTGVVATPFVDEFQAFQMIEDDQPVTGYYRGVVDTSLQPGVYTGGTLFLVRALVPYTTGGEVFGEKTFQLRALNQVRL